MATLKRITGRHTPTTRKDYGGLGRAVFLSDKNCPVGQKHARPMLPLVA